MKTRLLYVILVLSMISLMSAQTAIWEETFDAVPTGWELEGNWGFNAGFMRLNWSPGTPDFDMSAISPEITLPTTTGNLVVSQLYNDFSAVDEILEIIVMHGTSETVLWTYNATDGSFIVDDFEFSLVPFAGEVIQLKFRGHGDDTWNLNWWDITNLVIEGSIDNDLQALSITGPTTPNLNVPVTYNVAVRSNGVVPTDDYDVRLMQEGGIVLYELPGLMINQGEIINYEFDHTFTTEGPTSIWGEVIFADDEIPENNETSVLNITVMPEDIGYVLIGDGETTANTMPFNFFWRNSIAQTIYMIEEFYSQYGTITAVEYFSNFVTDLPDRDIKIWMAQTAQTDLSDGWIPLDQFTLVYDGTMDFPIGQHTIMIPLQVPFNYYAGNLVLMTNRYWEENWHSSLNHFYQTQNTNYPNRSRNMQSDSIEYDPADLTGGTLSATVPNTGFYITTDDDILYPPTGLTAVVGNQQVNLSWSVPYGGSRTLLGYNIYKNNDMINTEVWEETTYIDTDVVNDVTYTYYVTAVYDEGESMGSNTQTVTPFYPYPTNLVAIPGNAQVTLSWTAPYDPLSRTMIGYHIYRDGQAYDELGLETVYIDTDVTNGIEYEYYVTAVYDDGESAPTNTVYATPYFPYPTNLTATVGDEVVNLEWNEPAGVGDGGWFHWDSGVNNDGIGTGDVAVFDVAQRFTPADLITFGVAGANLTEISFFPREIDATYTLKVWVGGSIDGPGELVHTQIVTDPVIMEWNAVVLNSPVYIDGTQELWFGYEADTMTGFPAGCDAGPAIDGKGNMMYFMGEWSTLLDLAPTLNYNWNIHGFASTDERSTDRIPLAATPEIKERPVSRVVNYGELSLSNSGTNPIPAPVHRDTRTLLGYNVYRNDVQINTAIVEETSYTDTDIETMTSYTYYVTAVYTDGESQPSNAVDVFISDGNYFLVGDDVTTANTLPFNFWWRNSLSQTIYMAADFNYANGVISAIDYFNSFTTDLQNMPIKIWMANTSQTDLSAGWVDYSEFTLVYDGTMNFPSGQNTISIPLQVPFSFTGPNLVVMANRPMDTSWHSSLDHFFYTATPDYPNRSRNAQSDSIEFDPADPPAGTLTNRVPNTGFHMTTDGEVLFPPTGLTATAGNGVVYLSWNAPMGTRTFLGYNIYRNDVQINTTPYQETTYDDMDVINETEYSYYITAVYEEGESGSSNTVTVTPFYPYPTNLTASIVDGAVDLAWSAPGGTGDGEWMHWDDGVNTNGIGTAGEVVFDVAQRFTPADLNVFGAVGNYLTQVRFFPREPGTVYTVKVWTGGNQNAPGTLVTSQVVNNPVINDWNTVELNNPVYIGGTEELWFGYEVDTLTGHPAGCDSGPAIDGKGNMMYFNNEWTTLLALAPTLDYNWNIHGFISSDAGSRDVVRLGANVIEDNDAFKTRFYSDVEFSASNIEPNRLAAPVYRETRTLLGYNVYRNDVLINTAIVEETHYTDTNVETLVPYTYYVTAVYDDGESQPTNSVTVSLLPEGAIQIGAGENINTTTGAAPINIYFRSLRGQMVYTADEINAAGFTGPGELAAFGFYVESAPIHPLPDFIVRMRHTTAVDASEHDDGPFEYVYYNAAYEPVAGGWDILVLDTPFEWNGVDNILVDTAFAQVPSWNSSGQQRIFDSPNGFRFVRSDGADQSYMPTTQMLQYKPQIQMIFGEGEAPTLPAPVNLTGYLYEDAIHLNWDAPGTTRNTGRSQNFTDVLSQNNRNSRNLQRYKVYRHAGDGNFVEIADLEADIMHYIDTDLVEDTGYTYHVTAVYVEGESEPSNEVEVFYGLHPTNIAVTLSSHTVQWGEEFILYISVDEILEDWNITSYGFELYYDEEMLEFVGIPMVEFATTLSATGGMPVYNDIGGQINFGWAHYLPFDTEGGDLLVLKFETLNPGLTEITLGNFIFNAYDITNITPGIIDVMEFMIGDVNRDGVVTPMDASIVLQYYVGFDPIPEIDPIPWTDLSIMLADVDLNGAVQPMDASYILQYYVGIIDSLPVMPGRNTQNSIATVDVIYENGYLNIYSEQQIFGLGVDVPSEYINYLGQPVVNSTSWMTAQNIDDSNYRLALARAEVTNRDNLLLSIPVLAQDIDQIELILEVNDQDAERITVQTLNTEIQVPELVTALRGNYPNPFNPDTNIAFTLAEAGKVTIEVYNILGQKVITLVNEEMEAGNHKVMWNGQDERGKEVGSGIFFYRMNTGKYSSTGKMIMLK